MSSQFDRGFPSPVLDGIDELDEAVKVIQAEARNSPSPHLVVHTAHDAVTNLINGDVGRIGARRDLVGVEDSNVVGWRLVLEESRVPADIALLEWYQRILTSASKVQDLSVLAVLLMAVGYE